MKKLFKFLIVSILVFGLAACASAPKEEDDENGDIDEEVSVALLVGNRGDLSFNDSAVRGVEKAEEDFDVSVKVIEYGDDPSAIEPTMLDASDSGYNIIIAPSDFQGVYEDHAEDYPETTFVLFDEQVDYDVGDGLKNVYSIVYSANEASFLGGYLAAKLSETKVLGFLGGEESPIINDFLVGYIEGAQYADEDAKVTSSFVGAWNDSAGGKELSLAMINQGSDFIFGVAGGSGVGAFEAAVEKDILTLGVDSDQALIYEEQGNLEYANLIVSSVLKNVDNSLYRAIDLYLKDELSVGEAETLGIKEDGVGLADNEFYQELVPEGVRGEIDELYEQIASGDLEVDTAYGKSTEEINEIKDAVNP